MREDRHVVAPGGAVAGQRSSQGSRTSAATISSSSGWVGILPPLGVSVTVFVPALYAAEVSGSRLVNFLLRGENSS